MPVAVQSGIFYLPVVFKNTLVTFTAVEAADG